MSVFRRVEGGVWWYEFRYRGVRIRESSKSESKTVAQRIERERRRKMELGTHGLTKLTQPKTFSVACKAYLLEREANWEPKTRVMHDNSFRHLEPQLGKLLLNEITAEHFSKYQRFRVKEGAAGRIVNIETNLLRLVLRKAKLWSNLVDDVQSLKENTDTGRELSDDEVKRLLAACEVSVSRALYPAVLTSIHTGLRGQSFVCCAGDRWTCSMELSPWARARASRKRKAAKDGAFIYLQWPCGRSRTGVVNFPKRRMSISSSHPRHTR